jgi:hypothetical protein
MKTKWRGDQNENEKIPVDKNNRINFLKYLSRKRELPIPFITPEREERVEFYFKIIIVILYSKINNPKGF